MSKVASVVSAETTGIKSAWVKPPKTVLKSGLTYSLCSRVRNALSIKDKNMVDAMKDKTSFVDGRGSDREIATIVVTLAEALGAKFLASIRSSYLRPRMQIDFKAGTVTLVEPEVKTKEVKTEVTTEEKVAKSA